MPTGEYMHGVSHPQVYADAQGNRWLGKRSPLAFLPEIDKGVSLIQQRAGLPAAETHVTTIDGKPASVQRMFDATPVFPDNQVDPGRLSPQDLLALQKHMALDWMISNHDAHSGNFLRDKATGDILGIDKGQAFKFFGRDRLTPDFGRDVNPPLYPNNPVYSTLLRAHSRGDIALADPRSGEYGAFVSGLQNIPDDEYRGYLRPYATAMAAEGMQPDPEGFLAKAVARKNNLANDLGTLYDRVTAQRNAPHVAAVLREAGVGGLRRRSPADRAKLMMDKRWDVSSHSPAELRQRYLDSISDRPDLQAEWESRPEDSEFSDTEWLPQKTLPGMENLLGTNGRLLRGIPLDTTNPRFRRVWQMTYGQGEPVDDPGLFPDADLHYEDRGGEFDHPGLADAILEGLSSGAGEHWSTDYDQASDYAEGKGAGSISGDWRSEEGLPVLLDADWNGRGEDYGRAGSGNVDFEKEVMLTPGAPLTLRDMKVPYNAADDFVDWNPILDTSRDIKAGIVRARTEQVGVVGRLPTAEVAQYRPQWRWGAADRRTLYHLTDRPDFALNADFHPENNTTLGGDWPEAGIFLGEDPENWFNGYHYHRPYVAEFEAPTDITDREGVVGGYQREHFIPARYFNDLSLKRVLPYDAYVREAFGEYGPVESMTGRDFSTGERLHKDRYHSPFGDKPYVYPGSLPHPEEYARQMDQFHRWSQDDYPSLGDASWKDYADPDVGTFMWGPDAHKYRYSPKTKRYQDRTDDSDVRGTEVDYDPDRFGAEDDFTEHWGGIKTAMPPRSIDTEVSLMPASEFEEDLVEPPKKTKREPQPVQGELFDQPQKVSPSAEFEEDDPPFYSPNFPTPRGKQMALPQKTMREFGNPAIQGDTYRLTSFLDPEAMTQSVIDKYNDSSPEVREWGGDWYDAGREYIDHLAWITGRPPEQVAAVMAAFSPRTDWNSNMGYATHFLLNYPTEKIDPNDPLKRDPVAVAALKNSMGSLGENFDRAARVVDADPSQIVGLLNKGEEAQKVRNFYRNFMGHTNDVTIDAWMARALMGHGHDRDNGYMADKSTGERSLGLTGAYDVMSGAVQEAARRLQAQGVHITPRELQAIVWTHVNPTANYGDWTPEKIRAKIKRLQTSPPDKPLPDYTKGPGYQYLPEPSYQNRRNAAFEEDDAGHWSGGEFPPAGPNSTWYHASPYELAPRTLFHRGRGWVPMDGVRGRKVTAMHGYTNKPLPAPPTTYDIQPDNGARIVRSEESGLEYDVVARPNGRGDGYDVVKQLPTTNGKRPRTAASDFEDTDDRYSLPTLWEDYQNWGGGDSPDSVQFWGNVEEYLKDRHGLEPWPANGEDVQEYLDHYFAHPATMGMAKLHSLAQGRSQVDGYTPLTDDDLTQGAALGLLKIRRNQKTRRLEPIAERTAIKIAMPVLYRGLEHEFDPDVDANDTLPPAGYSHWTNSPALARQYAGPEGHVYFCDFPDEAEGESYIDEQGERPLYYNNGGLVGLRGVKGDEYLVYHGHPDYDPGKIKDVRDARVGATHHMYDDIFNPYTEEDTQNMVWDWDKGRFRPRRPDEDRMIPPMPGRTAEAGLLDERDAGLNTAMSVVPEDYRGQHQAPDTDYGASMDNPDMMFPDIATHPEYYDTYQPFDYQSHSAISRSRGRPDRKVDIYRALPMSALVKNGREHFFPLNAGDWVTPSYDYAKQHGEATLDQRGPWTILHTKAPAGQLYSEGNSIHEWAYQGDNKMTVEHPRARQQRYRRTKRGPVE